MNKKRARIDEELMLHQRGTKIADITPGAIISAAKADMRAKEYNTWLRAERKEYVAKGRDPKELGFARKYSFLGKHVRKAQSERDLVNLARTKNSDATGNSNINVRRIYDAVATLTLAGVEIIP